MADPIQGYFNSTTFTLDVNGFPIWNRAVGSEFMAKFAHTVLGNGAAAVTTGGFQVVKKTGMTVTVKPYFICKDGYMMYQTAETDIEFTSSTSEQVFYIGARLDVANNHFDGDDVGAFTTFVPATDIASCKLTITANAVTITDGMIQDLRYNTTYCGQLDEFRERSLALLAELEQALEDTLAGGVPAHASTHAAGGADELTDFVSISAQTIAGAGQTQARANISAAKAVSGVIDAAESATPINAQTGNYTLVAADFGKRVRITSSSNKTITVPSGLGSKFYCFPERKGTGTVALVAGSGVTINAPGGRLKIAEQHGVIMIQEDGATDTYSVTGGTVA